MKRTVSSTALALGLVLAACSTSGQSPDQGGGPTGDQAGADPIKVAVVVPLTGPFAFQGQALLSGARFAAEEINAAGGIEALGGAPVEVVSFDTGESAQSAVTAARSAFRDDSVIAGVGSWLTSFTLASSEVAQREGVPWLADSFGDDVTERGFDYVFGLAPKASEVGRLMLEAGIAVAGEKGEQLQRIGLIGDDTPAAVPAQESLRAAAAEQGIEIVVQERWTPPLADASAVAQKIVAADLDAVFSVGYSYADQVQIVQQLKSRGSDVLYAQLGGQSAVAQWREIGDAPENMLAVLGYGPLSTNAELLAEMAEALDKPFVQQDETVGYVSIYTLKAALEVAGVAEREALRDALATLEVTDGVLAEAVPGGVLSFDDHGRIADPFAVALQWQRDDNGDLTPCTVFPIERATCEAIWP